MKFKFGDIILAEVQYSDTFEVKKRPALVLFEEFGNIIVAGITSNINMKGSIIKINYIFTISEKMVLTKLFSISEDKKSLFKKQLMNKLSLSQRP